MMLSINIILLFILLCGFGLMWGVLAMTEDTKNCSETVQSCAQALLIMATLLIVIPITFFINEGACPGGINIDSSHQSFNKWVGFLVFIGLIGGASTSLLAVIRAECKDAKNSASDWLFYTSASITGLVFGYILYNVISHAYFKGQARFSS